MAGIGFELRKILQKDSYFSLLNAYAYAGIISSGPWLLSIFGILLLCIFIKLKGFAAHETLYFQSFVVYLISASLIVSAIFQQSYARYVADQCFVKAYHKIIPSLNGIFLVLISLSTFLGVVAMHAFFPALQLQLKLLVIATFVELCLIWTLTSVLSGLKVYKTILLSFLVTYALIFIIGYALRNFGLLGLFTGFFCGQFILLMVLIATVYQNYPSTELFSFDFFQYRNKTVLLVFTGLFFTIGVWVDKYIFWYHPSTGTSLHGILHYSLVYDMPIFLAYLCAVPGMAVFLLRIETDYMDAYQNLYQQICQGGTYAEIQAGLQNFQKTTRDTMLSVMKTQLFIQVSVMALGTLLFNFIHLPFFYLPLFYVLVLAVGLNVVFWALLDIFFYLDKLVRALCLTAVFMCSNAILTLISIHLGIFYFGYGLICSLLLTVILGFTFLNKDLKRLDYETFMLQFK